MYAVQAMCTGPIAALARCGLLLQTESSGLLVTTMSSAITAELIEMLFGMRTPVGRRNHVLDGSPGTHTWMGNFEDKKRAG